MEKMTGDAVKRIEKVILDIRKGKNTYAEMISSVGEISKYMSENDFSVAKAGSVKAEMKSLYIEMVF